MIEDGYTWVEVETDVSGPLVKKMAVLKTYRKAANRYDVEVLYTDELGFVEVLCHPRADP